MRGNTTVCKPVGMRKLSGLGRNLEPHKIVKFSIHNVTVVLIEVAISPHLIYTRPCPLELIQDPRQPQLLIHSVLGAIPFVFYNMVSAMYLSLVSAESPTYLSKSSSETDVGARVSTKRFFFGSIPVIDSLDC